MAPDGRQARRRARDGTAARATPTSPGCSEDRRRRRARRPRARERARDGGARGGRRRREGAARARLGVEVALVRDAIGGVVVARSRRDPATVDVAAVEASDVRCPDAAAAAAMRAAIDAAREAGREPRRRVRGATRPVSCRGSGGYAEAGRAARRPARRGGHVDPRDQGRRVRRRVRAGGAVPARRCTTRSSHEPGRASAARRTARAASRAA